jgi:hypothetical protein
MVEPATDESQVEALSASDLVEGEGRALSHELLAEGSAGEDPLLTCLVFLTRHYGRPRSAEVLKAGLPSAGRLPPSMFLRAAERAGFLGRVVKRRLSSVSKLVLPAVLILKDEQACVVIEYVDKKTALVMLPEAGGGVQKIERGDLEKLYAGYAIFVKPEFRFDVQRQEADLPRPRAWFWGTIFRSRWIYSQVAVAAVLINVFALTTPLFVMAVYDRILPNVGTALPSLTILAIGSSPTASSTRSWTCNSPPGPPRPGLSPIPCASSRRCATSSPRRPSPPSSICPSSPSSSWCCGSSAGRSRIYRWSRCRSSWASG